MNRRGFFTAAFGGFAAAVALPFVAEKPLSVIAPTTDTSNIVTFDFNGLTAIVDDGTFGTTLWGISRRGIAQPKETL